ncbi:hypothetical protein [Blastococcus sp. SYSU D00813]
MPAPASTAPRVPRLLQRRAARGSALGMGLLVASGVTVPAALADEDPATGDAVLQTPDTVDEVPVGDVLEQWEPADVTADDLEPDFGVGKSFGSEALVLQTVPDGRAPADLDLSGAVYAFRDVTAEGGDGLAAVCVTATDGTCTVERAEGPLWGTGLAATTEPTAEPSPGEGVDPSYVTLDDGTYVIEQLSSVPGLERAPGVVDTFEMGDCWSPDEAPVCITGTWHEVDNASLFHTSLTTTVVDAGTGDPLAEAGYRLTGPDYRHRPGSELVDDCQGEPGPDGPPLLLLTEETTSQPGTTGTGATDTGITDTGAADTGATDTGTTDTGTVDPGDVDPESLTVATSGADGVLTHVGCLLPGTWTLEPVTTPEGYEPATAEVELGSPWDAEAGTWDRAAGTTVQLAPVVVTPPMSTPPTTTPPTTTPPTTTPPTTTPPTTTPPTTSTPTTTPPDPGTDPVPPAPTAPVPPASAPAPVPAGGGTGTGTGGTNAGAARPVNGAPAAVPSAAPTAAPATATATATAPALPTATTRPTTVRPTTVAAPQVEAAPALETRGSTNYLQVGLVGFGVLFTGLVLFLVLLLRRRAREHRG